MDRTFRLNELFKVGLGPSSSHTVGPMKAAAAFMQGVTKDALPVRRLKATAFGSLAWTGRGHATDRALVLGLCGLDSELVTPEDARSRFAEVQERCQLRLPTGEWIPFDVETDVVLDRSRTFERHPNAMVFEAFGDGNETFRRETWFSVGGGFIEQEGGTAEGRSQGLVVPFPYASARELLVICRAHGKSIADVVFANEISCSTDNDVLEKIDSITAIMFDCIERGLAADGELPGGLRVVRRAGDLFQKLEAGRRNDHSPTADVMGYASAFAMAVNEENAAGGRVVTAPTNGAAGVIPSVMRYYRDFCRSSTDAGVHRFLLVATAFGGLIKRNASISGAEVGCQGEVGSAAAMAAAGLAAALGGTNEQAENAAEIALQHHLGMTCDPVGGLVQIPCIERNAFGAVKAINAAHLALLGQGTQRVTFDQVVETMRQTGADMAVEYRETSRGGLAVNVPEC